MGRRKIHSSDKNKLSANERQPKVGNRQLWKNKQEFVKSIVLKNIAVSMLFGALFWVIDSLLDCLFFYEGSFWELLIYQIPPHEVYIRFVAIVLFLVFGLVVSVVQTRRQRALQALQAANQQLQASEQQLRASQEEIRALAKFPSENPNPVLRVAKDGTIIYSNESSSPIMELWQCEQGERLSGEWHDLIVETLSREKPQETEVGCGERIYSLTFAPVKDADSVNVYGLDITERKRAEEVLQDSEKKYHSLFTNMLNGFAYCKIIVDEKNKPVDFVYLEINDAFEKLTTLKRKDVVGKKVTEAILGIKEAHPELFDIYGKTALTGKGANFDIYFKPLKIWLSISVYSPQKGYFVAIFENITERKKAEEELRAANQQLRASEQQLKAANQQELVPSIVEG